MAQHTKISAPTHNYHKSPGINDPVEQGMSMNAMGLKTLLSQNQVRLAIGHLQVDSDFLISWSNYGDIWMTFDSFHEMDITVVGLPFKQSIMFVDGQNYIIIIYSEFYDNYRVIMSGTKLVPGTLRLSQCPHNGFFNVREYCDFDDRVIATLTDNGTNILIQGSLSSDLTGDGSKAIDLRGFYVQSLTKGEIERYDDSNFVITLSKDDYVIVPFVHIDGEEYRGNALTYKNS